MPEVGDDGLCRIQNAKDWRKGLGDWLWLGVGLAVLMASRNGMASGRHR